MTLDLTRLSETKRARALFTRKVALDFGDDGVLNLTIDASVAVDGNLAGRYSDVAEGLEGLSDEALEVRLLAIAFCDFVVEWDGTDSDGNPILLTPASVEEHLGKKGILTLLQLLREEAAALAPKASKTTKSSSSTRSKKQGAKRRKS